MEARVVCPKQSNKRLFVEVVPVHGQNDQNFPQDCSDRKSQAQVKINGIFIEYTYYKIIRLKGKQQIYFIEIFYTLLGTVFFGVWCNCPED